MRDGSPARRMTALSLESDVYKRQVLLKDYKNPNGSVELTETIKVSASLQRMYVKYAELKNNNIELGDFIWDKGVCVKIRSYSVLDYIKSTLEHELFPYKIACTTLNAADFGAPQRRERFVIIGSRIGEKPQWPTGSFTEENYRTVRQAIEDLEQDVYKRQECILM